MKDITDILKKAVSLKDNYNSQMVADEIEKLSSIWCRLEDDSNLRWYLISESNGKTVVKYYGYLCVKYPIAFLMDDCPPEIIKIIKRKNILCEKFYEKLSCSPEVLSKYIDASDVDFIDDSFLNDDSIPFDEELFLKIDEGIVYLNPYNFTFENIK